MDKNSKAILAKVSALKGGDSSEEIYDEWAGNYDHDLISEFGYLSPTVVADAIDHEFDNKSIQILDYGCGTGLVGEQLYNKGFPFIDGLDISSGMLDIAASKNVYRKLDVADLTIPLQLDDALYDAAVCVGAMGAGHIGKEHMIEMIRPVKMGGIFIVTVNGMYFEPDRFDLFFREQESRGRWKVLKMHEFNYMSELVRPGWLLVAQVL
ncbi:MAG: putative TPR repeat methyltransferase [Gammaproteobacteria bacterium]|jgi:predicted TPR repeat methyltransferase